jgi:CHASE3 domain sensor protein
VHSKSSGELKTKFMSNLRVQFAFTSTIATLLIIGAVSYGGIVMSAESGRWVRHTHEVLGNLKDLRLAMESIESGCTGFVLTGKESYLESFATTLISLE